ncbi:MAG TPA: SCP2 sterol-binding domain-containing protein [Herpetosiphonaceae bacterium]
MAENLDTISVREYFTTVLPQQYAANSFEVPAGLEQAAYAIQFRVGDQPFALKVANGNQVEVVEGVVEQPLVEVSLSEDAWREGVTGAVPSAEAMIHPSRLTAARFEKLQSLKGKVDTELTKADGGVVNSSMVFNGAASPEVTLMMAAEDFGKILSGDLNSQMAFMTGKIKFKGDMNLLMKLGTVM